MRNGMIDLIKNDILSRLSIADIYGDHKFIKTKKGSTGIDIYKMLCPFHSEKKPSFLIYSDTLHFHCFGCNEHGSPFDFIMKKENITYPVAQKILADRAGVEITNGKNKYARLYELMLEAQEFYSAALSKNEKALAYLTKERQLTQESINKFHLGYADDTSIVQYLKTKDFTDEEIAGTGLGIKRGDQLRDFFRNRIMFPLMSTGRTRGFGGRVINGGEPKYLNTSTTPIFQKSEILYGLQGHAIKEKGFVILVEGNIDVIMCHQYGFNNTVATLGTALSEEHIAQIGKLCDNVILVLDRDSAGKMAAERNAKLLFEKRIKGAVAVLPEGEDPDSFLRKGGDLQKLIDEATPFSVFLAKRFPNIRKMIFHKILERGRNEITEFLAYMGTSTETETFRELSALYLIEHVIKPSPVVYSDKNKGIEVKRMEDFLVLFSKGRFLYWNKVKGDCKQQAEAMVKDLVELKKRGRNSKK